MNREEALKLVKEKIKNQNLIKHCLAVEACLRALAKHFGKQTSEEEKWGLCGLLHDIDYEETKDDPTRHSILGAKRLEELGVDEEIVHAVKTHNEVHGIAPTTLLAKALYYVDPLTGLIIATTLVLPSKKLRDLKTENVLKRFKEKAFARGVNRKIIASCSEIGLTLEGFVEIGLKAMQGISDDLGL